MDKQIIYVTELGVYVSIEKGKLCCQLNSEWYCTGCKVALCNVCAQNHAGPTSKCPVSLNSGECWPLAQYIVFMREQDAIEAETWRLAHED